MALWWVSQAVPPRSAVARASVPMAGHCWPIPSQETLKHSKAGLAQSIVGSLGPGAHKVLFKSSECLWCIWGLILNMISPSYHPVGVYPLPLDMGYLFFWWDTTLSLMAASIYSSCWGLHGSCRWAWGEVHCCFKAWARPGAAIGRALEHYIHSSQSLLGLPHPQLTCQHKARGPGGPGEQVTICLSPHSLLQGPHKHTYTHIPILTSIIKNSSPSPNLVMDPVGNQDCPKATPHLSLPAKSLSSGKRG